MALPRKRQRLSLFLKVRDVSQNQAADELGIDRVRFSNIIKGQAYPSPRELTSIEAYLEGMPASVYFDEEMLVFRHAWTESRGPRQAATKRAELERLRQKAGE